MRRRAVAAGDLWILAALAEACAPPHGRATADEVACTFNHHVSRLPRRRAQGVAQTLLRLHRLGRVEVGPTVFGVNTYSPRI